MLIKKIKAFIKWTALLMVVFCLSFLIAGGANFYLSDNEMFAKVQDTTRSLGTKISDKMDNAKGEPAQPHAAAATGADTAADADTTADASATDGTAAPADGQPSNLDRISRMLFLKKAVASRIRQPDYVKLTDIPEAMQQAVIAVEDRKFYSHWGFDMEGIFRAALVNMQYGEVREGASTITQQLVKNLFLSQEQTMGRKAEEFILAMDMELNYSKEEILELYLNSIYFGSGYYGIGQAAEGYFGKEPAMLALPEAAMLAGIPNAPSLYSPYVDFMLAKKRQFIVLDAMVAAGFLRESIAEDAKIKPIYLAH
ncbi:transglycosylase domain-containing protein [Anaerovibrio sp.]|uniref:transglycosylase domain-containing protein n=1 Tax=Anaerovibrio sp. TaxID=1872532 RepID=UPI003F19161A